MNGLKISVGIVLLLFVTVGVFANFRGSLTPYERPTEAWLETVTPMEFNGYTMVAGNGENPMQTYQMDELTYEILNPFGIVARQLRKGNEMWDVVIIAGDNADSFHDQRACFRGQGWEIMDAKNIVIETEERGDLPFVLINVKNQNGQETMAAYAFQGPSGKIYAEDQKMWGDFMMHELKTGTPHPGYFYRFIPLYRDVTEEELRSFVAQYMDEAYRQSDGLL